MSTTQPEALRENYTAADMATAEARGFRDGVASVAANAGSEPVAWRIDWPDEPELGHYFSEAPTDSGRCQPLYTHPSPPEGAGWRQGVEAAAAMLSKKADDFAREHGYADMGSLSFGCGSNADAKLDHHSLLCELAEEVRGLIPPTSAEGVEHG